MKHLLIGICLLLTWTTHSQLVQIPKPLNNYYHSGADFSRHHEVLSFFESLQSLFPNQVKIEPYGKTNEGRTLFVVYLSNSENLKNLSAIKNKHLNGDSDEQISIAWLSYNVHGNESCGTEAAMETAYRLLTTESNLLNQTLVIMDPCLNPDGRDRYVNYFKQYHNQSSQLNVASAEHDENWPGGRPNHYLFDLNRDWAWLTQVESQQRINIYNQWLPHVHVDFHEQGMNEPYYFPPAAEPYHEIISNWQRDFQKHIGKHHASYFDKKGWLYFSKEIFDLLYPSYGDTYPSFNGAIGMTYEQGGSGRAGLGVVTSLGDTLTLAERIEHHVITGISTIETMQEHQKKLIEEFQKYQSKSKQNATTYILDGSSPNISSLTNLLDLHQISYKTLLNDEPIEIKGFDYFKDAEVSRKLHKSDVIISCAQTKGNLINVLFEQRTALSDSLTYDITAWSLPYAYGINCIRSNKAVSLTTAKTESTFHHDWHATVNSNEQSLPYAIAIPWENLSSVKTLVQLIDSGLNVSVTEKEIILENNTLKRGTLLVLKADNMGKSWDKTVNSVLFANGINGMNIQSGWASQGTDLGSSSIKNIKKPKIGVLYDENASSLSVGEIWYFLDHELNTNHFLLRDASEDSYLLNEVNVIFIPDGSSIQNTDAIREWISNGGICIVMGSGASNFMQADFGMNAGVDSPLISNQALGSYGSSERNSISETIIGSIYRCQMDLTHPLSFGYNNDYFTLRLNAEVYPFNGTIVQQIKASNAWVSGFAGYKVKHKQDGATTVGIHEIGKGKIVYFFDNPLFRGFWQNGKLQVANAIYFLQ